MIENWKPIGINELEKEAELAVIEKNNCIVTAGPGAGKTELLAQKALYLLDSGICQYPKKILAISFKKDAARNLSERIKKRSNGKYDNRFISKTYDSFFKGILDQFVTALPKSFKISKNYEIINLTNAREYLDAIADEEISYEKLQEITPFHFDKTTLCRKPIWALDANNFEDKVALKLWKHLLSYNKVSFLMISRLCELILYNNPILLKCLRMTYSHIFLDEFQDTTGIQYNIIKMCFCNTETFITAVGDDKQRIMEWAGALPNIFNIFKSDFSASSYFLHMNFRSSPALIRIQQNISKLIDEDIFTIIPFNSDTEVEKEACKLFAFLNPEQESSEIANYIEVLLNNEIPREICILARQKCDIYSSALIKKLNQKGIKARIEDCYQDLLAEPIILLILAVLNLTIRKKDINSFELIKDYCESIGEEVNDYLMKKVKLEIQQKISGNEEFTNIVKYILNFLDMNKIESIYPQYAQKRLFISIIKTFIELFNENLKENNFNYLNAIQDFLGTNTIPIMTIHKSKGLEFNTIIFLGLEDSAFWNYKKEPRSENCAFFVAFSRARKKVIFTFSQERKDRFGRIIQQQLKDITPIIQALDKAGIGFKSFIEQN